MTDNPRSQPDRRGFPLSTAALHNVPVVAFLAVAAMAFGVYSYFTLPAREDPEILVRDAVIQTAHPGLEAEEIEQLVTKPIEEALLTVAELEEITSESRDGLSVIHAIIEDQYTDLDIIWEEVAETVSETQDALPEGTQPPLIIDDFGDVGVITAALTGEDYALAEITDFAEHVRNQLISVKGTKKVEVLGGLERRIFVEIDDAQAAQLGVTPFAIAGAVARENAVLAGGTVDLGEIGILLDPAAPANAAQGVADTLIALPNGRTVRLGDVARVREGYEDPPQRKAYYDGQPAVVLSIAMHSDHSVINFSRAMNARLDEVAATLPVGLDLARITVQAEQVERAVYGVSFNLLQTLLIVLIVVVVFLGLRTGLIVGSIVPSVILATLAIMAVFGLQLERMSLATIVISLGLLVDNGIVIAEDFKRRLEEGLSRDDALKVTSRELAFPLLSSSLTTMAVFLPLLIMNTASSEYTRSITFVVIISLTVSWFFAMTVTTSLCHRFIPDPKDSQESRENPGLVRRSFRKIDSGYEKFLRVALRHRRLYVGAMIVLFLFGGFLMGKVPQKFFPDSDREQILIYADLPVGVTSRATDEAVQEMMAILGDDERYPEIQDFAAYLGFGGPRFVLSLAPVDPAPHTAFLVANATDRAAAEAAVPRLRDDFRAALPQVNARVTRMFLGPSDPNVIHLQVKGPDAAYVYDKARELEELLLSVEGTIDVWSNWRGRTERLAVEVDRTRASASGITAADVAEAVQRRVDGLIVGEVRSDDDLVPIVMRGTQDERESLAALSALPVFPQTGGAGVPLAQVASLIREPGFGVIAREDLIRTATVEARNLRLTPQDMQPLLAERLQDFSDSLEPGHVAEFDGILNDTAESNAALAATGPIVLFLIVLLLIVQFKGYKRPAAILLSLPFVVPGAAVGLLLFQADFGFMVILGLYALMGIIINNSIVLVDRCEIERAENPEKPAAEAVVTACVRRLRPILMTTLTTVAGLLPLIIAQDVLFYGMAVAMAFGLLVGTGIVSLGMTPVLYSLFFGISPARKPRKEETQPREGASSSPAQIQPSVQ